MIRLVKRLLLQTLVLGVFTVMASAASFAAAGESILVTDAWSRATPPGTEVGAVYLRMDNVGSNPITVLGVTAEVAMRAEIHSMKIVDDVMKMEKQDRLVLPVGEGLVFEPGGYHIMLMGLTEPLVQGETFVLTVELEDLESVAVEVKVMDATHTP